MPFVASNDTFLAPSLLGWLPEMAVFSLFELSKYSEPLIFNRLLLPSKIVTVNFFEFINLLGCAAKIVINHELSQLFTVDENDFGFVFRCIFQRFFSKIRCGNEDAIFCTLPCQRSNKFMKLWSADYVS